MLPKRHAGLAILKDRLFSVFRLELTVILMNEELFVPLEEVDTDPDEEESQEPSWIEFHQVCVDRTRNPLPHNAAF